MYRLARSHATGVLTILPARGGAELLVLRRGMLMGSDGSCRPQGGNPVEIAGGDPGGRRTAQRLERLGAQDNLRAHFDGGLAAYPPGALLRQFNLSAWARGHLEAQLDAATAQTMVRELAGVRLALRPELAPEPFTCDEADRRILAAMAVPRRLEQIWPLARTPRFRLLSFLYFLRAVGAVTLVGVAAPTLVADDTDSAAYRLLGLPSGADRDAVKRAYRRLARVLHPDLNGSATEERRRQLERMLAAVNGAYKRLVDGGPSA
ncbi:MAG TPA: J domain-containing protein [Kofleriaceae bacterium]|nr:J domain-containing protein [Kofleriaceae bacterium]